MDPHHSASAVDSTGSFVATKAMEVGGVSSGVAGWITGNNVIALLGLTVAIAGFIVNLYFQNRRDKREAEFQTAKLAEMNREQSSRNTEEE